MDATISESRALALARLFQEVIEGKRPLAKRSPFIESICAQPSPPICVEKLIGSTHGLPSLQVAMSADRSATFHNGHATKLFNYFASPGLKELAGGSKLKEVLISIVQPTFWEEYVRSFKDKALNDDAQLAFAWLCDSLLSLLPETSTPFRKLVGDPAIIEQLLSSKKVEVRNLAHQIKKRLTSSGQSGGSHDEYGPGGRHDNDFVNFREIAIVPTADEVQSNQPAFIRPSTLFEEEVTDKAKEATYLDNQFRLLREDMLYELREDLEADKKRKTRTVVIKDLKVVDFHYRPQGYQPDNSKGGLRWGIVLQLRDEFGPLRDIRGVRKRKEWLEKHKNVLRHQSMACLFIGTELIALATIERDEDLLSLQPPKVVVHIEGQASIVRVLLKLKMTENIKLVQINTALFAYQPVLQAIQEIRTIPFSQELLFWSEGSTASTSSIVPAKFIEELKSRQGRNTSINVGIKKSIIMDKHQSASLLMGLTQKVSLIQGPPGTGKSFIGALLAKILHSAGQRILVVCYTNHALDQFLEELLDIGIPKSSMVRLGGKSTPRTEDVSLHNVRRASSTSNLTRFDWEGITELRQVLSKADQALAKSCQKYRNFEPSYSTIMEYLKLRTVENRYFHAFTVPASKNGETLVSKGGKPMGQYHLLNCWIHGWDAGVLKQHKVVTDAADIWKMRRQARQEKYNEWKEFLMKDRADAISKLVVRHDRAQAALGTAFDEPVGRTLASMRIIGCTTTAAAKYREEIKEASPDVLLVEEAGEILESHILTALPRSVKQMILIGDHKQLRPKVSNYQLTVEKGEGFDLNRSLFERLVLKGYPHVTLSKQHRMRPEISALVRHLTYPDLVDDEKTQRRPNIAGVRDNVVFIHHSSPEDDHSEFDQSGIKSEELGSRSSKRNQHEVVMVLKILRYLAQQGYGTDDIVILTGYLGQLRALQEALKQANNDTILNDLDSADLIRAGLITPTAAEVTKRPIRLATIDNYQGEESDIVIASLTRSNKQRNIGFMARADRLNVLLSRARNGLIMVGDAHTFKGAKSQDNVWGRFFDLLIQNNHLYDGLPVRCERHTEHTADLCQPEDFDRNCPEGGCNLPCNAMLKCGIHKCPSSCHQIVDHSQMKCRQTTDYACSKRHRQSRECHAGPPIVCPKCVEDNQRT